MLICRNAVADYVLPGWVVFHVPHDSTDIPPEVRQQFSLSDEELAAELVKMTDHLTGDLFTSGLPATQVVRFPNSRLVVDVERFEQDASEPMSQRGMGVVYTQTSDGKALRHPITTKQRQDLIDSFYKPHHARLNFATERALSRCGRALVIDVHSFPSIPLPYESNQSLVRPDICIGADTDGFHTPASLRAAFASAFKAHGFSVALNTPFSGTLVPSNYLGTDSRVLAIMVEVNRALYIDEATGSRNESFDAMSGKIRDSIRQAIRMAATQS
jgi:N-formylglutamate deformylase